MKKIADKNLCTGCGACSNVCPKSCIKMEEDYMGFKYPVINQEECNDCQMCVKTCPILKEIEGNEYEKPSVYAAWSKDEIVRYNSTTGGLFSELAKGFLKSKGNVVGAIYNQQHFVEHYMTDDVRELEILRQSKYIQSDTKDIYKKVREKLLHDERVLFVGSPCQVAGLNSFLRKKYDKLITCDYVCRGNNSPLAYIKYLEYLEKKYKSKVKCVWFKNKTNGWNRFGTRVEFENGESYYADRYADLFMRGYLEANLYIRPACAKCKFKQERRIADISFADFWGVGKYDKDLDEDKGTSLVFINSDKGKALFDSISYNIFFKSCTYEMATSGNACILNSVKINEKQDKFFVLLQNKPFDYSVKKFLRSKILINGKKILIQISRKC